MNFSQAVNSSLIQKYATFRGRACRAEWWYFLLFSFVVSLLVTIGTFFFTAGSVDWEYLAKLSEDQAANYILTSDLGTSLRYVSTGLALALFLPGYAVTVRRLQDLNLSYYWSFPYLAASVINIYINITASTNIDREIWLDGLGNLIVIIYCLVFLRRGDTYKNRFGKNPLVSEETY